MSEAGYLAPTASAEAEVRDRGSRFLARLVPCRDEAAAREALAAIAREHPGATHHCYAWRLGEPARERAADAGEPAGTAGVPILRALQAAGVADALVVVTRWFGGTKLGKGGLARAYALAAREAIAATPVAPRVPAVELVVEVPFERLGPARRLLAPPAVELLAESYGERARFVLRVARARRAELEAALADLGLAARDGGAASTPT
ncbi:MAG TPA: YigZ family protein [Thermoanaerobaculia bacterium]|nr:YigZ family protein [Thermoanaerobaculia bacterium]